MSLERVVVLGMLVAVLSAPGTARASTKLEHVAAGVAFEIGAAESSVCVLVPVERREPVACGALMDVPTPTAGLSGGERMLTLAAVMHFDWSYTVGVSVKELKNIGEVSADNVDEYAAQMEASLQPDSSLSIRGTQGPRKGDILELNGVHALRYIVETNKHDDVDPSRGCIVLYHFYQQDRVHNVYFMGPRAHGAELLAASERAMSTLRMPPAPLTRFGAPRWLRKTIQMGRFALLSFAAIIPFALFALLMDRRSRRATAPKR